MKATFWLGVGSLLFGLAGPIAAQPAPRPVDLNRRVYVDVNQVEPFAVLAELSAAIGTYMSPETAVSKAPISLRVWNVRARTALDAVCEVAGCRWQVKGRTLLVTAGEPPPPIPPYVEVFAKMRKPLQGAGWKFERAPLRTIGEALSAAVGAEVVFEGADPKASVTVDLSNQPPFRAAFTVMSALGWDERGIGWEGLVRPDGPIVLRLRGGLSTAPAVEPLPPVRVVEPDRAGLTMPKFASGSGPSYTSRAAAAGIQGVVELSCLVTKDGEVTDVKVVKSLEPGLDAEAVKAARDWRFTPAKKDGKLAPVRVTLEVPFAIQK